MLALAFFKWWYDTGWLRAWSTLGPQLRRIYRTFSVPQLIRTLFSPWHRIINFERATIGDRLRALGDNALSRVIGTIVRLLTLVVAGGAAFLWVCASLVRLVTWPLLPVIGLGLIIWGMA